MRNRLVTLSDPALLARWYAVLLLAACFGWPLVLGMPAGWPRYVWLLVAAALVGWSAFFAARTAERSSSLTTNVRRPPWWLFLLAGVFFAVITVFPVTFFGDEDLIALPSLIVASRIARFVTWPGLTILVLIGCAGIVAKASALKMWHVWAFACCAFAASAVLAAVHLHPEMLMVRYPPLVHLVQFIATVLTQGSPEFFRLGNAFWVVALGFSAWYAASEWPPAARLAAAAAICLTPLGFTYHILLYQACGELTIGLVATMLLGKLLRERNQSDRGLALLMGMTFSAWILYRPTALALAVTAIALLAIFNRRKSAFIVANITLPLGLLWVSVYVFGSFQYSFLSAEPRSFPILAPILETLIDLPNQISIPGLAIMILGSIFVFWKRPSDRHLLLAAWTLAIVYTLLHELITVPTWYGYGRFNALLMLPLAVIVGGTVAGFRRNAIAAVALLAVLVWATPWSVVGFLQSYRLASHSDRMERTVTGGVSPTPLPRVFQQYIDDADTLILIASSPSFMDLSIARGLLTVAQRTAIIERSKAWTPESSARPVIVQAPAPDMTYTPNIPPAEEQRLRDAAAWALKQSNVQSYRLEGETTLVVP